MTLLLPLLPPPPARASPLRLGRRGRCVTGRSCPVAAPAASASRRLPCGSRGLTRPLPALTAHPASPCARRLGSNIIADAPGDLPRCLHGFLSAPGGPPHTGTRKKSAPGPRDTLWLRCANPRSGGKRTKNNPLPGATSHLAPPAAPSQRSRRRGCRPGAPRRGIFAPRHCAERERDGGEITPRRDPREARPPLSRDASRCPEMPPPALKGAHKAALPRARGAPGPEGMWAVAKGAGAQRDLTLGGM